MDERIEESLTTCALALSLVCLFSPGKLASLAAYQPTHSLAHLLASFSPYLSHVG